MKRGVGCVLYTVVVELQAMDELTEIWLEAADPAAVEEASNNLDVMLATDPLRHGIQSGSNRIVFVPPLGVVFLVQPDDRLVIIKQYYGLG
jgi:hypothetical protein